MYNKGIEVLLKDLEQYKLAKKNDEIALTQK